MAHDVCSMVSLPPSAHLTHDLCFCTLGLHGSDASDRYTYKSFQVRRSRGVRQVCENRAGVEPVAPSHPFAYRGHPYRWV